MELNLVSSFRSQYYATLAFLGNKKIVQSYFPLATQIVSWVHYIKLRRLWSENCGALTEYMTRKPHSRALNFTIM